MSFSSMCVTVSCRHVLRRNPSNAPAYNLQVLDSFANSLGQLINTSNVNVAFADGTNISAADYTLSPPGALQFGNPLNVTFSYLRALQPGGTYDPKKAIFITFDATYLMNGPACKVGNDVILTQFTAIPVGGINQATGRESTSALTGAERPIVFTTTVVPPGDKTVPGDDIKTRTCASFTGRLTDVIFTLQYNNAGAKLLDLVVDPTFGNSNLTVTGGASSIYTYFSTPATVTTSGSQSTATLSPAFTPGSIFSAAEPAPGFQLCFLATWLSTAEQTLVLDQELKYGTNQCANATTTQTIPPQGARMTTSVFGPVSCLPANKMYTFNINVQNAIPGSPYQPV